MSSYKRHPGVDAYLDALPDWQRRVCGELRELIHAADPEIEETVKRSVQPYFVCHGNVCALLATKDHVNLFLYDGTIVADPHHIISSGQGNKTARMISYYADTPIRRRPLGTILRQIVKNNRAGGWRAIVKQRAVQSS